LERSVADINKITSCELIVDEASELSEDDAEQVGHVLEDDYIRILDEEPMEIEPEECNESKMEDTMAIEELQPSTALCITNCEPL
jgi:hypothetical protein